MRVHVGTSGYNYPEWRGHFYPEGHPAKAMFGFYAERFHAVEINYTFYRMPTAKTTEAWRAQAPDAFRYALKAPRRITHEKRLIECADPLAAFTAAARVLGPHMGPLLFQLPPTFRLSLDRLTSFLSLLPPDLPAAFEFRHDSWHAPEVYERLRHHHVAMCIADFGDKTTPFEPTARHGYFRLRDEGYTPSEIDRWAGQIADRAGQWDDAFVFFKHEDEGKGPEFAKVFVERLAARGITVA
jgi:uncharacterized protein YecE (DUF72 family)